MNRKIVLLVLILSLFSGCGRGEDALDSSSAAFLTGFAGVMQFAESDKSDENKEQSSEAGRPGEDKTQLPKSGKEDGDKTQSSESGETDGEKAQSSKSGKADGEKAQLPESGRADREGMLSAESGKGEQKFLAAGALQVNGTSLVDSAGNPVQLRGISTHGIAWYPGYINEECFRQLRDEWNVNMIRLAMYTAESGGYCSGGNQEQLKQIIRDGVEYATALNLYVIIDWHILSDGNPNTHKAEAREFFAEMAEAYADYGNVLYEICNEPNGGTSWREIKVYAEEIIPVIRACDEDGIIIVGTPNWSQYVDQAAADPIVGYDNIMYALHFYAATHKESLRNTMTAAIDAGLPIFVTEYGICDASGNGSIDEAQARQWISVMDEYNVSYVAWNLSNKNETSAILSSGCAKTSGFEESDLSVSGKWIYCMLTGKTGNLTVQAPTQAQKPTPEPTPALPIQDPISSNSFSYTASLVNSWESDGKIFSQYDLTVSNLSETACTQWAIDVVFCSAPVLSDGWNGDFSVNDRTLHISSKDYNGSIAPGSSVGNIGFIVSGGDGLQNP